MKTSLFALVASTAVFVGAAWAQDLATLDTDGDGLVSYTEMTVLYPDLTEDQFASMDTSADGSLDEAEIAAGVEAGTIMAQDS